MAAPDLAASSFHLFSVMKHSSYILEQFRILASQKQHKESQQRPLPELLRAEMVQEAHGLCCHRVTLVLDQSLSDRSQGTDLSTGLMWLYLIMP